MKLSKFLVFLNVFSLSIYILGCQSVPNSVFARNNKSDIEYIALQDVININQTSKSVTLYGDKREINIDAQITATVNGKGISLYLASPIQINTENCIKIGNVDNLNKKQDYVKEFDGQRFRFQLYDGDVYVEVIDCAYGQFNIVNKKSYSNIQSAEIKPKADCLINNMTLVKAIEIMNLSLSQLNKAINTDVHMILDDYQVLETSAGDQYYKLIYAQLIDGIPVDIENRSFVKSNDLQIYGRYITGIIGADKIEFWDCFLLKIDKKINDIDKIISVDSAINIIERNINSISGVDANEKDSINSIDLIYVMMPINESQFRWELRPVWRFCNGRNINTNKNLVIKVDAISGQLIT